MRLAKKGPEGQQLYMGTAKVGPKGQIVIPKEVRDMFGIEPGDNVMILADSTRGIAIERSSFFKKIAAAVFDGKAASALSGTSEADAMIFAQDVQAALEENAEEAE